MQAGLEARQLAKFYSAIAAVRDFNLTLRPGTIVGLLGPNGSGKSTTVSMLTGVREPSAGQILFDGHSIADRLVVFKARVGYVPEYAHLYTFLSGREQLDLIGDNAVHMAIFGALGWAAYLNGGGALSLGLALLAMIGNACSLWFVTRAKTVAETSGLSHPVQAARLDFIVKNVASRDFSLVVLILSLFNLLGIFLWFAAIGSNLFWMTTAWLTRSPAVRA